MARLLDKPEHWYARAEKARTIAESLSDPEAKRTMESIAAEYELLARRAEEYLKKAADGKDEASQAN